MTNYCPVLAVTCRGVHNFIRVRDREVIRSVAKELGIPMTALVDVAVRVLKIVIKDDVLFYNTVTIIHFWDEGLARELLRIKGRVGS